MKKEVNLEGDIRVLTPKEYFNKGVEDERMRRKIKEFLNDEFQQQSNSATWDFLEIEEVGK